MNGKKKQKNTNVTSHREEFLFSTEKFSLLIAHMPSGRTIGPIERTRKTTSCVSVRWVRSNDHRTTIFKKRFSKKRFHHASDPPCRRSPRAVTSVLTGSQTVSISSGKLTRKAGSITLKITMLRQIRRTTESSPTNGRSYQFFLRPGTAEPTVSDRGPTVNHPDCRAWTDDTLTPHARAVETIDSMAVETIHARDNPTPSGHVPRA